MKQNLKQVLNGKAVAYGLAACIVRTVEIVTVTKTCGFDFLVIDTEHSPIGIGDVATLCVCAYEAGLPALVRTSGPDTQDIARVLDCGAEGIIVPHVDSVEQARFIVEKCRFAPVGKRSLPSPLARLGFRVPPAAQMMQQTEAETFVVVMIESAKGLDACEAMAEVSGVDALMIGANDLAADLGFIGQVDHPDVLAAFARIARAAQKAGKVFSVIGVGEPLLVSHAFQLGARLIVNTNDVNLLVDRGIEVLEKASGTWQRFNDQNRP